MDRRLSRLPGARAAALVLAVALALLAWPAEQRRKQREELPTQTLELPKDPPAVMVAETDRLVFRVTPLHSQGLLSRQVRDALRWLLRQERGGTTVRLRAFVAGTGDMRRVQTIVSEVYSEKRLPLPALSVVQVGALPREGAQVVLESVSSGRRPSNPNGLAFISGQAASIDQPLRPLGPLADEAIARLRTALSAAGAGSADVLRVTCYLSLLDDVNAVRQRVAAEYPSAALNFVQRLREPMQSLVECEAVARLRERPSEPLRFLNPPGLGDGGNRSEVALVGARRLALTGTQLAFGFEEADARLAFERLGKTLEGAGASYEGIAMAGLYPLSLGMRDRIRKVAAEFHNGPSLPATTVLPSQGLPGLDASFALDVIAVVPEPN